MGCYTYSLFVGPLLIFTAHTIPLRSLPQCMQCGLGVRHCQGRQLRIRITLIINPDKLQTDLTIVMETMVSTGTWVTRLHSDDI